MAAAAAAAMAAAAAAAAAARATVARARAAAAKRTTAAAERVRVVVATGRSPWFVFRPVLVDPHAATGSAGGNQRGFCCAFFCVIHCP